MKTKKEKISPQAAYVYFKCDRYDEESCNIDVKLDGFGEISFEDFKPSKETMNKLRTEIVLFTKKKIGEM